jgi:outer membrane protein assembly factor BamD
MIKLFLILSLLMTLAVAQDQWVQEEALFSEVNGKSMIVRIDQAFKNEDWSLAVDLCDELSRSASKPANRARALILKADALVKQEKDQEAFEVYQEAIEKYPAYIQSTEVVDKQRKIGDREFRRVRGRESIFLNRQDTIDYYNKVITNAPFGEDAPFLMLRVAMLQIDDDQPEEAVQTYRKLVKYHRTSTEAGYARVNLAQYYLNLFDKIEGDQRLIDESKSQLILFTQQFSSHPMLSEAKRRLKQIYNIEAERLYLLAVFYNRRETPHYRPEASKRYLYKLLIEYGDSDFVDLAKKMLATLDPDYESGLEDAKRKAKEEAERNRIKLPPEATDPSKRKILIKQGDSDKFLLPIRDLDLTPIENTDEEKKKLEGTKDEKK